MSLRIDALPNFGRELKLLKKKYPSVVQDLAALVVELTEKPQLGVPLGHNCYKIRLAVRSKGQGKSGGARVITCVALIQERLTLLAIYDKSERDNISDDRLRELRQLAKSTV